MIWRDDTVKYHNMSYLIENILPTLANHHWNTQLNQNMIASSSLVVIQFPVRIIKGKSDSIVSLPILLHVTHAAVNQALI